MRRLALGLGLAAFCAAGAAQGAVYNFAGTLTNGGGIFGDGTTLTGSLTFDESKAARLGSTAVFAVYDSITALSFTIGGNTWTFANPVGGPEIQIDDDPPGSDTDRLGVVSRKSDGLSGPEVGGLVIDAFLFRLDDATNGIFGPANGGVPTGLTFADFTSSGLFIYLVDPDPDPCDDEEGDCPVAGGFASGTLTAFGPPIVIPLPAGMLLVLSGLAGLAFAGRRRATV